MAATNPIYIVFNRQTGLVVPSYNGSVASIPDLPQGNVRDLKIQFVDPSGASGFQGQSPWTVANMSAFTLACYLSAQPLGTGGPAAVAQTLVFAYDDVNNWFTGSLDLTPVGVSNLIGANPAMNAWLEFDVSYSGNTVLTCLNQVNLKAVINKSGANNPVPAASYPTTQQANATYWPIAGLPGQPITLISKGGTKILLVPQDDGTVQTQKI